MAYAAYELWLDYQPTDISNAEEIERVAIGVIQASDQNVKRKFGNSQLWNPIKKGDKVFAKDSIRTGLNSYTLIALYEKSSLQLEENSLIELDNSKNKLSVNFKTGSVKSNSLSEKLQIKVKDSFIQSSKAQFQIKTDKNNKAQISVTKGKAFLTANKTGERIQLDSQKEARIDNYGKMETNEKVVNLISPDDKSSVIDSNNSIMYPFTWSVLDEKIKKEVFEISKDPKFTAQKTTRRFAHQAISMRIQKGVSYWRVGWDVYDKNLGKVLRKFTAARSIELKADNTLELLSPNNAVTITQTPGNESIDFKWRTKSPSDKFIFEISQRANFTSITFNKTLSTTNFNLTNIDNGVYFWRVSAYDSNNKLIGRSEAYRFVVEKLLPQAPKLLYPQNAQVWSFKDPLRFEWENYNRASKYRWIISKKAGKQEIFTSKEIDKNIFSWEWTEAGNYWWRVEALNSNGVKIAESLIYKVTIDDNQFKYGIEIMEPKDQEIVTIENRDPLPAVHFQWQPKDNRSPNYNIVISDKADLSQAEHNKVVDSTMVDLALKKEGIYYWKVIWKDPTKDNSQNTNQLSSPTYTFKVSKNKNLAPVELLAPEAEAEIEQYKGDDIKFDWEALKIAKKYRIIIERKVSENSWKKIVDKTLETNSFTKSKLIPGNYRWSIFAFDSNGIQGMPSELRLFQVLRKKPMSAPVLKPAVVK